MRYCVKELPVTGVVPMLDGRVIGIRVIDHDKEASEFVIYDPDKDEVDTVLASATYGKWECNDTIDIPRAISDKGGIFTGDYISIGDDDNPEGYKISEFDLLTGEFKSEIRISDFTDNWLNDYRVADIIRPNEEFILIVCFKDDEYIGGGLEVFSYYPEKDEVYSMVEYKADAEDYMDFFFDLKFDRNGHRIICKRTDDRDGKIQASLAESWDLSEIVFDETWQSCDWFIIEDDDEGYSDEFNDFIEKTLAADAKPGNVFRQGFLRIGDKSSKSMLVDEVIDRKDYFRYDLVPIMNLVIAEVCSDYDDKIFVLGYFDETWQKLGEWIIQSDDLCRFKCFSEQNIMIIESGSGALMISLVD